MRGAQLRFGFTLIELIVVLVLVAALSAILFPIIARAKRSAKATASVQYIRQEYIALALYEADEGNWPTYRAVQAQKRLQAACSPLDTWGRPCWGRAAPMLGSFGYSEALLDQDKPDGFDQATVKPLLADIFRAETPVEPFSGDFLPDYIGCAKRHTCEFPERIFIMRSGGSLRTLRSPMPRKSVTMGEVWTREVFSWPGVFARAQKLDAD